ncbi:hypothetical protein ACFXTI_007994 [Malus domestica]
MNDYDGKCEISRIFNLLDIDSIEQLKHLDHMRFLLGWIGPQALDSDVQIFPVLSKNRSSFAEFTEVRIAFSPQDFGFRLDYHALLSLELKNRQFGSLKHNVE